MFDIKKYMKECQKQHIQIIISIELEEPEMDMYRAEMQFRYKDELISDTIYLGHISTNIDIFEQINDEIDYEPLILVEIQNKVNKILEEEIVR
ncbi:hypothetical protein [Spiroplasma sp. DGKH1]|uniref:hypothetical protein n=1 Tax=Spiroplasma sp. DGKH1 TaxID=3050074 RepID=UPI0034C62622